MSRFHTRQRIALLLALVISVAGLAPRPSQAAIGMPQERGWINFPYGPVARARNQAVIDGETMWVASKGAFRTDEWNEEETIYVDDNSLMLWAMSKKDYYSWSGGIYARSLRNYIISTSADGAAKLNPGNGKPLIAINPGPEFAEGHIYTTTNNLGWIPMNNDKDYPRAPDGISDSAIVSFVPSLGLVSISIAYPDHIVNNQDQSAWLRLHIARTLAHQDEIVGKTPVAVGFEDKRLRTTAIAFHMLASAMWYQHTGDATYLAYAQRAWNLIKQRQVQGGGYDKAFVEFGSVDQNGYFSVLRHEQILASMAQTFPIIGDYNGLGSALQTASNALKTVTAPVDCAGNWKIHRGFYVGPTPCADAGKGGLKFVDTATGAVWYRELIIGEIGRASCRERV